MENLLLNLIIPKLRWLSIAYTNPNIFGKFSRISSKEPRFSSGFLLISAFSAYFTAHMVYILIHSIQSSDRDPDLSMVTIIPLLGCLFTGIVMIFGDIVFLRGGFTMENVLQVRTDFTRNAGNLPLKNSESR
ncbi:hypothetical protein Fcan01_26898 [Folsomia candida]|uniref:Uncharacterized protein n=1 Tax=Folsomia candida TaxID=158441 RepID=A0A226CZD5_FOLCA|nr:hypothetical protein Fcan01_26898 [Folsomia candida]